MNTLLQSILDELCAPKTQLRNAKAQLDAIYAESSIAFEELFVTADPRHRLIITAYLYGRESHSSTAQRDRVLEAVALLTSTSWSSREYFEMRLAELQGYFGDVSGMPSFIESLRRLPMDWEANAQRQDEDYQNTITCANAVALVDNQIPALYRVWCNLFRGLFHEGRDDRRKMLHMAYMCCRDVPTRYGDFKKAYGHIARERDFVEGINEYDPNYTTTVYDVHIRQYADEAITALKEAVVGGFGTNKEQLFIAWRLWENGLALDWVPEMTKLLRRALYCSLGGNRGDEPGEKPELERLIAWFFGEVEGPLENVIPDEEFEHIYITTEVCYFWKHATFPARFIQFIFKVDDHAGKTFTHRAIPARELTPYLINNGMDKKALFKIYATMDENGRLAPGAVGVLLDDLVTTRTVYAETNNENRAAMLRNLYLWLKPEHYPNPDITLLVDALLFDYRDIIDDNPLFWALKCASLSHLGRLLRAHAHSDLVKARIIQLINDPDEAQSTAAREVLEGEFGRGSATAGI